MPLGTLLSPYMRGTDLAVCAYSVPLSPDALRHSSAAAFFRLRHARGSCLPLRCFTAAVLPRIKGPGRNWPSVARIFLGLSPAVPCAFGFGEHATHAYGLNRH